MTNKLHGGSDSLLIGKVRGNPFAPSDIASMMSILVKGPTALSLVWFWIEIRVERWKLRMLCSTIHLSSLDYPAARLFSHEPSEGGVYAG